MKVSKRFKKILSVVLSLTIVAMLFVACSGKETPVVKEDPNKPVVVTDQIGRKVEVPKDVKKVVSSYYISSSLLIALDAKESLVGIEMKAESRGIYKKAAPEFLDLPAVGSGKGINVEEILKLNPDLVIIPARLKEFVAKFEELKIPVIVVNPESMEEFKECITLLGTAIGKEDRAKQLLKYYDDKMEMITKLTKDIKDKPSVYLSAGESYLSTTTSKMYQNDLIKMAGGTNVSEGLQDGYWANISPEQLIEWNPEYMFKVSYAKYSTDEIINDNKINSVDAIKNNNVFEIPSKIEPWDYPTPSSVLGILYLTNKLHPEVYSIEDYKKEAKHFYKEFFKIDVSDQELGI